MNRLGPGAIAAALALAAYGARGQELQAGAMQMVEIVGTAPLPGVGIDRKLLPYMVQSESGDALRRQAGSTLPEFLGRELTGVGINDISGSPYQADVTYRGYRASPILGTAQGLSVFLDGVRVNEPFGDVVNWDMVPEAAIGKLLLVPGTNPIYGLNTLGGALALSTRSGRDSAGTEAALALASGRQKRLDLAHGVRGENGWHAFASATAFLEEGWRAHSPGRIGQMYAKAGHTSGESDWSLALLAGRSRLQGNGLLPDEMAAQDRRAVYTHPDQSRNRLFQLALNGRHQIDARTALAFNAYTRNSRRDAIGGDIGSGFGDYIEDCAGQCATGGEPAHSASLNTTNTRQRSHGASVNASLARAAQQVDAGMSVDAARVSFAQFEQDADIGPGRVVLAAEGAPLEASSSVTGSSRAMGVWFADTWAAGAATHLTAAARYNHARVANTLTSDLGAQAPESFTYRHLNPSFGLVHEPGGSTSVFASLSTGNRVPTVIELGCANPEQPCRLPVGLQSDPYLAQVLTRTLEGGVRWQQRGAKFSAVAFRTVNRNDILFLSAGPSRLGYFANFPRTLHRGADLSANVHRGVWDVRASYSYLAATYDAVGELFAGPRNVHAVPGTPLAGLARHTFKAGIDWRTGSWSAGAGLVAVSHLVVQGNEDGQAEGIGRVPGKLLANLHAGWRGDGWELAARVTNLFDRRYASYGAAATSMFPGGRLITGQDAPMVSRFVAPGAPRAFAVTLRTGF